MVAVKRIWLSSHVLWDLLNIFISNYNEYYVNFFDNFFEDISVRFFLSNFGIEQIATLSKKSNKA